MIFACWLMHVAAGVNACWAAEDRWTGAASDSWQDVANWQYVGLNPPAPSVPNDDDIAVLATPASGAVRLFDDTAPINGLYLSDEITLYTNGHILSVDDSGNAVTIVTGGARLQVDADALPQAFDLTTDKLGMLSGGTLHLGQGSTTHIEGSTSLFTGSQITADAGNGTTDGGVIHFGDDVRLTDAQISLLAEGTGAHFAANSTINALDHSTIRLRDLSISEGITFNIKFSSSLEVVGETHVLETAALEISGSTFQSEGPVVVDGGQLKFTTLNALESSLQTASKSVVFSNDGQLILAGPHAVHGDVRYQFSSGANLRATGSALKVGNDGSPGHVQFSGEGTSGHVHTLILGTDSSSASTLAIEQNASVTVDEIVPGADFEMGSGSQLSIDAGASLHVISPSAPLEIGYGESGGNSATSLSVGHSGALIQSGIGETRVGSASGPTGSIHVHDAGRYTSNTGSFHVLPTGLIEITGDLAPGVVEINGPLDVQGAINLGGDAGGELYVQAQMHIAGGSVQLSRGKLVATSIEFSDGGILEFQGGTLSVGMYHGSLTNAAGTLAPGEGPAASTIEGDYTQLGDATLELQIGGRTAGTDFDLQQVGGTAILGGTLAVDLIAGFVPTSDDVFAVLLADTLAGVFDNVTNGERLDTTDGLGSFQVNYGEASLFDRNQIVLSNFEAVDADLDGNGMVDGADFLSIQQTNSALIPAWEMQFGQTSLVSLALNSEDGQQPAAALAASSTPEPSGAALWWTCVGALALRRLRPTRVFPASQCNGAS
ncbi:MAG: hypothetical protein KDA61_17990 [Planctomycetales bacterium]|nr:hypothetical protein [Planctomycetales bacterium]